MVVYSKVTEKKSVLIPEKQNFKLLSGFLDKMTFLSKANKYLFELVICSKLENYLRKICLEIYARETKAGAIEDFDVKIIESFIELLKNLDMLHYHSLDEKIVLINEEYLNNDLVKRKIDADYNYVRRAVAEQTSFKTPLSKYIYYVIEYIHELKDLSLNQKITASFSDTFYSDLGETAFNLFNKKNYSRVFKNKTISSILDIGCGNGNFIDFYLSEFSDISVTGIEKQTDISHFLLEKYRENTKVTIINEDILNLNFQQSFDVINMSYMLFYLTEEQQKDLLKYLHDLLSEDGEIIVCQYFPNYEEVQIGIAEEYCNWGYLDKYKFTISQNILYAEVLLNDCLTAFENAIRYSNFVNLLSEVGLHIKEIYKADENFYSFYLSIAKEKD